MAFEVSTNVSALNVYNNLGTQQAKAAASLAKISSGLKAAGGGDVASQGTAATLSAHAQLTQANISKVQTAINTLQAADSALGELVALGQKGLDAAGGFTAAGADASAITAQITAIGAGITSVMTATFNGGALGTALSVPVGGTALPLHRHLLQPQLFSLLLVVWPLLPRTLEPRLMRGRRMRATWPRCRVLCRCLIRWQRMRWLVSAKLKTPILLRK